MTKTTKTANAAAKSTKAASTDTPAKVTATAPKADKPTTATKAATPKAEKKEKAAKEAKPDAAPSKKSLAMPIIAADIKAGVARKDTIAKLLAPEIGCSSAGANTYYQNVKSGAWK